MIIKKNIAISDTGFVFHPSTGDSFSTNPIGLEIIKLLKEGKNEKQIKSKLLLEYQTDEATFEKDYYDFLKMLEKHNLSENDIQKKD